MSKKEELKTILKEELHLDEVNESLNQEDTPEWDSMAYMAILGRLEENFGIEITPDNIQEFSSFEKILKVIEP